MTEKDTVDRPEDGVITAADGVQEAALTRARGLLTRLIDDALLQGVISALTARGRRRIYLVPPAFYEQAIADRAELEGRKSSATPGS